MSSGLSEGRPSGDDDEVDGLDARIPGVVVAGLDALLKVAHVGDQDVAQPAARGRAAAGEGAAEDILDLQSVLDIVAGGGAAVGHVADVRRPVVEEVDVDAVRVVARADGRDAAQQRVDFAPPLADHGARVVDQEDGVERGQEGEGVFRRRDVLGLDA